MTRASDDPAFAPPELDGLVIPTSTDGSSPAPTDGPTDEERREQPIAAGRMTPAWRLAYFVGFGLAIAALGAVWAVATQIGHTTWWMGPAGDPRPLVFQLFPFYLPFLVVLSLITNRPGVSFVGIFAGLVEVVVGAIDLSHYLNLGLLEIAIGLLMIVVATASRAGVALRPEPSEGPRR